MKGFLFLGAGAFLTGAAVAFMVDRRSGLDEDYGEDHDWPAVPYTAATHPDSPQERIDGPAASEAPAYAAAAEPAQSGNANGASSDSAGRSDSGEEHEASPAAE